MNHEPNPFSAAHNKSQENIRRKVLHAMRFYADHPNAKADEAVPYVLKQKVDAAGFGIPFARSIWTLVKLDIDPSQFDSVKLNELTSHLGARIDGVHYLKKAGEVIYKRLEGTDYKRVGTVVLPENIDLGKKVEELSKPKRKISLSGKRKARRTLQVERHRDSVQSSKKLSVKGFHGKGTMKVLCSAIKDHIKPILSDLGIIELNVVMRQGEAMGQVRFEKTETFEI